MVSYMGPFQMSPEMRTRIIRLAAAKGIHPDAMVTQLIERGLETEDPAGSVSGGDVDLVSPIVSGLSSRLYR